MVKNCAKCGKELGLFANKHKTENNSVICDSCFKEWKEDYQEKLGRVERVKDAIAGNTIQNDIMKKFGI